MKTNKPAICPHLFNGCRERMYGLAPPTPDEILSYCLSRKHYNCRIFRAKKLVKAG
ncbi:MAG: hypothetical protein ACE5OP_09550 [Candidatus Glassbacteria bacterium]